METISNCINELCSYAEDCGLLAKEDRVYATNRLLELLHLSDFCPTNAEPAARPLEEILSDLCDHAAKSGLLDADTVTCRDLFDTSLMGALTPPPSTVIAKFFFLYHEAPSKATEYYYKLCRDCDYIRSYRVCRDLKWAVESEYGDIDITINLSKPEKDPRDIAAARTLPPKGYPKCLLCHENEGYAGTVSHPARQNLRQIPLTIDGKQWYLQYSPYVYYNEHCILLSGEHSPMKIDRSTFRKQLDFVEQFPHYFLGSNADLPIVGGSILSHDHMQGGRYPFAMEKAPVETPLTFRGHEWIRAGIVAWPMSVIRIAGKNKEELVDLADTIQLAWRRYSDPSAGIYAETAGEPHNTVTPIARMRDGDFELDLVLRNNITTPEHPMGVFHPHEQYHNIKKENIGLIEVMGLAVLPARLKTEMQAVASAILENKDLSADPVTAKHKAWVEGFRAAYTFTSENVEKILRREIGKTFVKVLEDAGVYKRTPEGKKAFYRFCESVQSKKPPATIVPTAKMRSLKNPAESPDF